ncbi:MAG TPA: hypothetical protein VKX49_13295 [Bryobacteraceae bacterium]|nr:hypothetical protein [Bryobacteraceae bacterium]
MIFLLALWLAFSDIGAVKAEPDLDKRSELALVNADHNIDQAEQAYKSGDLSGTETALKDVSESVVVCYDALQQTRTPPRKSKYYKRAELKVQALLRRLNGFREDVGFETQAAVDAAVKKVSDVHDHLIADIMSKKK